MADEQKLGPNATYIGEDSEHVVMHDVTFERNKSVNVVDLLGEEKGKKVLQKLAGNQFFKVDGGPDHAKAMKERQEMQQKQGERRQQRQAQTEEERKQERQARRERGGTAPLPPEGYKTPDQEKLESPGGLPRAPKK